MVAATVPRITLRLRFGEMQWSMYGSGAPGSRKLWYFEFRDVSFDYPSGRPALRGVSFVISTADDRGLVGLAEPATGPRQATRRTARSRTLGVATRS